MVTAFDEPIEHPSEGLVARRVLADGALLPMRVAPALEDAPDVLVIVRADEHGHEVRRDARIARTHLALDVVGEPHTRALADERHVRVASQHEVKGVRRVENGSGQRRSP